MWDRHTIRRKINSLARRRGWTWAPVFPHEVALSVTSRCHLACRTCPIHGPAFDGSPDSFRDMDPVVYERLRRELLPAVRNVMITGAGEPFLAPIFYQMLGDMFLAGKRVCVVTSATIIRLDALEKIVNAPAELRVSLDGTTPEVMDHIRPGANLARVLEFMETINEIRQRGSHPEFQLQINFVVTRSNVEQLTDCIELARRYGVRKVIFSSFMIGERSDDFARESLIDCPEAVQPHWERACRRGFELGIEVPPILFDRTGQPPDAENGRNPQINDDTGRIRQCPIPWWTTLVDTDGTVKPCCLFPPEAVLGNLRDQSFRSIWNGPRYRAIRRTVNTPDMPEVCKRCTTQVRF